MARPADRWWPAGFRGSTVSGERLMRMVAAGARPGVELALEMVYDMSQVEVPKESTALAQSGRRGLRARALEDRRRRVIGHVVYGGEGVPYAARIHEEVTWTFKTPGTKAQYLADPLKTVAPLLGPLIARTVRSELARRLPPRL